MLRAEVLTGQACPEGLGAVVYHGMSCGLAMMLTHPPVTPALSPVGAPTLASIAHDRQFVRLLANLLLRTQAEVIHVY